MLPSNSVVFTGKYIRRVNTLAGRRNRESKTLLSPRVEMQPDIKGLVVSSWLLSADTFKVSPHLSFVNKPFVESGANAR
jgi:hypothetical protein